MIEDEKRITNVEKHVDNLETKFEMFMQAQDERFNNFMRSHEDFKAEMRQQNQMRAEEIRELRQDMKDMQKDFYTKMDNMDAKMDAKIDKLESKIENIGNHVRNLSVATIIGVATIAITVVYSILTH